MENRKTEVRTFSAFHYDVAYRKTYSDYLETGFKILDAGLALLEKHPEFIFAVEQVVLIREYLERFPSMKNSAKKFVQEGRLLFAPGMFTMPDVNIPSGENFLRNFLIGRDYLAENLQAEPTICWMADIFGHHPQMPQIARLCGYSTYMFERGKRDGDDTVFLWEGIDGSKILTQWEVDTYYGIAIPFTPSFIKRGIGWISNYIETILLKPLKKNSAVKSFVISPMGGDFRVPEEDFISLIQQFNRKNKRYRIAFHSPEKSFAEIASKYKKRLPVLKTDFNPIMQGCYSSRIRIKQYNRRLENLAYAVELLDAIGDSVSKDSENLWKTITINSFHDIICGSLIDAAYREVLDSFHRTETDALTAIRRKVAGIHNSKTLPKNDSLPLTVFNPLAYPRTETVEIPLKILCDKQEITVTDTEGKQYPAQVIKIRTDEGTKTLDIMGKETGDNKKLRSGMQNILLLTEVSMPPAGIKTFNIKLNGKNEEIKKGYLKVEERLLENRFLRVRLADNGLITSFYDKENGAEFVPKLSELLPMGMNNIILQSDHGDLWSYYSGPVNGSVLYSQENSDPMPESGINLQRKGLVRRYAADANATGLPEIVIKERGPVRACIEVKNTDMNVTSGIYLSKDEKMLRFKTVFIPKGKRYRLRAAFPTSILNGKILYSIPFGFVKRKEGEYPAQNWIEYSDGEKGLCLLNRGIPGNNVTGGVMMLSLFRAVSMEDEGKNGEWFEEGVEHTFEYALRPFGEKDKKYNPARTGEMFNHQFYTVYPENTGYAPESSNFIEIKSGNAEISCVRKNGDAIELRIYETTGTGGKVTLSFSFRVKSCSIVDLKYQKRSTAEVKDRQITLALRPFEVVTCLLQKGSH
jgi:alpha-mannosidase